MKPQDKPYTMTIYQLRELHRSMRKAGAAIWAGSRLPASGVGLAPFSRGPDCYQADATPS